MSKKLYEVTVTFRGLVYANSENQAMDIGRNEMAKEDEPEIIGAVPWTGKEYPTGWDGGTIPWGEDEDRNIDILCQIEALEKTAEELGYELRLRPDKELSRYERRANLLTIGELKSLPDDSVVWATYREHGEREYRANGPYRIRKVETGWMLEDGSSFSAEFELDPESKDTDGCYDPCSGEGDMYIYHVRVK